MKTDALSIYLTVVGVITVANGCAAGDLHHKNDANELLIDNILKNQHQSNLHLYIEITYLKPEKHTGRDQADTVVLNRKDENKRLKQNIRDFNKQSPILPLRADKLFQRVLRDDEDDDEDIKSPSKETTTTTTSSYGGWGFPSMSTLKSLASSAYSSLPSRATVSSFVVPGVKTVASYLPATVQTYLPSAEIVESYLPSMSTLKSLASSAYSSFPSRATVSSYVMPGVKTVASYLPASVQSYLPSAETVESYLHSMETIKSYIPSPTEYIAQKYQDGFNPARYLGTNRTDQLVNETSEKVLSGEKHGNITDIVDGIGQNLTQRAVNSASPTFLRMVIHKVVYGMAVGAIGPIGAYLAKNKIAQMADVIAEKAEMQCLSYGLCSFDVYSYLKNMHWGDIAKGVLQMAKRIMGTTPAGGDKSISGGTTTGAGHTYGGTTVNDEEKAHAEEDMTD